MLKTKKEVTHVNIFEMFYRGISHFYNKIRDPLDIIFSIKKLYIASGDGNM